jgi:hypothetical protein
MNTIRYVAVAAIMMTFACLVQAQDTLSGTWEGETRSGSSIVLTLAVKGTVLTGTLVRNGESTALSEGQVAKNTFTFKATLNDQTEAFSGELTGDEIKIWMNRQGPERAIVLRRAKGK